MGVCYVVVKPTHVRFQVERLTVIVVNFDVAIVRGTPAAL